MRAIILILLVSCSKDTSEQQYVTKELAEIEKGLAARNESEVLVGCIGAETSAPHMPPATAEKIAKLCYVEAPKLLLQNAIANVKKNQAAHPDPVLKDMNCMELLVSDAFKITIKHPTNDAELKRLVDEFTQLCPAEATKARERAMRP
jgi:hypothetical protein